MNDLCDCAKMYIFMDFLLHKLVFLIKISFSFTISFTPGASHTPTGPLIGMSSTFAFTSPKTTVLSCVVKPSKQH